MDDETIELSGAPMGADPDPESLLDDPQPADADIEPGSTAGSGPNWSYAQKALFALMVIGLMVLLAGLAATAESRSQRPFPPRPTPMPTLPPACAVWDAQCCIDEHGWSECCRWYDDRYDRGLFDAEAEFANEWQRCRN